MTNFTNPAIAAKYIQDSYPDFKPKVSIILGSGLGEFANLLSNSVSIDYTDLLGFPKVTVQGHHGKLVLGELSNIQVACLQGRSHYYEGNGFDAIKTYIRTLKLLGSEYLILTNAAGSLCEDIGPGELMLIHDHINFQPNNPLIGPNDEEFGTRFPPLDNAYDKTMQDRLFTIAKNENIRLHKGVYLAVPGPSYETAAEIRAFKILGADAVGMSTVPEVLVANHCGLKTAVISIVTNYASGISKVPHSHESVVATAALAAEKLKTLVRQYIASLVTHRDTL